MADVPGVSAAGVVLSAATSHAYGDTATDRVDLLRGWLTSGDVEPTEVEAALSLARGYLAEDSADAEMVTAVVVLARVLR